MSMTREQAMAWTARWRVLGAAAPDDGLDRSPAGRVRALGRLRAFALAAGRQRDGRDDQAVRERFQTLRQRLGRDRTGP
jgi:hypothetical protein